MRGVCRSLTSKIMCSTTSIHASFRSSHLLFILILFAFTRAYPVTERQIGIEVPPPEIINFMRRFGYLETNPSDSEALYHEGAIIAAIKNIQKYGAIDQTGKIDAPTIKLLSSPRCGVPDIRTSTSSKRRLKRYIIGAKSWEKRTITYYIANWSLKIDEEQIERDIKKAFEMWSRYSRLKFERVNDTSADIIVGFGSQYHGDNYPFDGPGNILAHAFYPYEMGSYGGDIHFDEDENWKENSTDLADGVDFYSVALHELGHSLGLAHSPVYSSIMFAYYKGPGANVLDYDDILAMYELYVKKRLKGDEEEDMYTSFTTTERVRTTRRPRVHTTKRYTTTARPTTAEIDFTYQGDYETVSDHKRRHAAVTTEASRLPDITSRTTTRKRPVATLTNICQGHFDAVSMIQDAVYIFKGKYVWRLTHNYTVFSGYPKLIHALLPFLPDSVQRIDAVYERYDGTAVFFTGHIYWEYKDEELLTGGPQNLTNLLPMSLNTVKIDAAMVWPKNSMTYIFAGQQFWRIDERNRGPVDVYPKPMTRWVGIPSHIDAAATLPNGKTYFFKGNLYWLYNNRLIRPERGYPRRASTAWLRCPMTERTRLRNTDTTVSFI